MAPTVDGGFYLPRVDHWVDNRRMKEEQIIARIRTMTDLTEVEKQLAEVRDIQREVSSEVRSELADIRQWLRSSSLFTREDLDEELKELEPATKLQMTLARYEEELRKRKEELTGNG
jgi:signal transduction histidine kinase